MKMFRVWFTVGWSEEDYLDVRAKNADEACEKVLYANSDIYQFDIQSVEPLEREECTN